ncbi:MAG TPA: AraC family transcriptional regulator, partial [Bordetella sp.]|nr:AraC family transcriptional regulator [Bordetella sp.]
MTSVPAIYSQPRKAHEWWRGTLPTVPASADWEAVIERVERIGEEISLVVLNGRASRDLYLPAPDHAVFGIQVCLEGHIALTRDNERAWQLGGGMALVFHHGSPAPALWHLPAGRRLRLIDIRLTPGALSRLGWECLPQRLRDLASRNAPTGAALTATFVAPPACVDLAWALSGAAPVSDPLALQAWRTARVLEALALVADVLSAPVAVGQMGARQHAAVIQAATMLRNDCSQSWTPPQLARLVGV